MRRSAALIVLWCALAACSQGPVAIDRGATCAFCRMTIDNPRLAGQLVAPGEEPRLYDDIGCLANAMARGAAREMGTATAYVADHRTGRWIKAQEALYTRVESVDTPMGSHLIAHADAPSRAADPAATGGTPLTATEALASRTEAGHAR